jgi:hypothetical protein
MIQPSTIPSGDPAMYSLTQFPGFAGIVVGVCGFAAIWGLTALLVGKGPFNMDAYGEKGAFEPLLSNYLDIAKFVLGIASGSIVLLVGSSAFHGDKGLPASFASPLFVLALCILYGVLFMFFLMFDYEDYRHRLGQSTYTRFKYSRNTALGLSALACFCVGYAWLIVIVTGQH